MNNQPLVSVIIPTYNRAHKVCDAIESVLNQTYSNIQLIVVDDGSSDNTAEILKRYSEINYIRQENAGQAAARNAGLLQAKGSIIASLDSDDKWEPNFLATCVAKLVEDSLDFVFANWYQFEKDGYCYDFFSEYIFLKPYIKTGSETWINLTYPQLRHLYITSCPSPSSSFIIRKSSLISGWSNQIHIGDDWCLLLNLILTKKCRAAFTMEKLWVKQVDSTNVYEDRNKLELCRLLNIEDVSEIIRLYGCYLTKAELKIFQKMQIEGFVEIAKHSLLQEKKIPRFLALTKKSLALDVAFTFKTMRSIYSPVFERQFKRLINAKHVDQ